MKKELEKQFNLLMDECMRVKQFINENEFHCGTAPFVIVKRYRDELKEHLKILRMNMDECDE